MARGAHVVLPGYRAKRDLPRAPSLELYVLPIGGGQHVHGEKHAVHAGCFEFKWS
jgi:hypothetical protein